jgi:hypothetical protein
MVTSIDVHIVKQDQLVATSIGMHDAVLVNSTGDSMSNNRRNGDVLPAASRTRTGAAAL